MQQKIKTADRKERDREGLQWYINKARKKPIKDHPNNRRKAEGGMYTPPPNTLQAKERPNRDKEKAGRGTRKKKINIYSLMTKGNKNMTYNLNVYRTAGTMRIGEK